MEGKVEQFMLLAKNAKGLALVDLVTRATAEPGLFTFGEILSLPAVQQLQDDQRVAANDLLELFAYGTWEDYRASPAGKYPVLSEAQAHKLKLLSVVSAADGVRTLAYDDLLRRLELPSVRALEDLLIADCLYGGLLRGKLDQLNKCLLVEGAFCRDVRPDQVSEVAGALGEWLDAANSVLGGIEERIDWTLSATTAADKARGEAQQVLETERKSIRTTIEMQALGGGSSDMFMDDQEGFSLPDLGEGQDARPGPTAGRHTKRRR